MLDGRPHDKKIDHWSLGCMAFEVNLLSVLTIFLAFNLGRAPWTCKNLPVPNADINPKYFQLISYFYLSWFMDRHHLKPNDRMWLKRKSRLLNSRILNRSLKSLDQSSTGSWNGTQAPEWTWSMLFNPIGWNRSNYHESWAINHGPLSTSRKILKLLLNTFPSQYCITNTFH